MEKKLVKNAIMLCVGHKDWSFPKNILMKMEGKHGELLENIAKRAFERYKAHLQNENISLLSYSRYGTVEVFDAK